MVSTGRRRDKVRTGGEYGTWMLAGMLLVAAAACRPDATTARGAAESFLDAHYVAIDLPAAMPFTRGVARAKVEREMALVAGVPADETTRKPRVWYRLLEEHPDGAAAVRFLYEGTVSPEDAERFQRRWLVTVRRDAEGWHVTNFEELPG